MYLDDVIVIGRGVEDGLKNMATVFERIQASGLKLKPSKCHLLRSEVLFLGHVVSGQGIAPNPELVKAVQDWSPPSNITELQAFLGLCNYYRRFVRNFSLICSPLYELQRKGTGQHQEAFSEMKRRLTSTPVLAYPTKNGEFVLDTDASNTCIGAVLSQFQEGEERVVAYASAHLQKVQQRYCVTRRELLAVVRFARQFRHYLLGRHFTLRTDHNSLTWLFRFKSPEGQLARWLEELSQFDFSIEHRAGVKHGNADALSRAPEPTCDCYWAGECPDLLPCQGCSYCRREHQRWARFDEDVDDVVPLAIRRTKKDPPATNQSAGPSTPERDQANTTELPVEEHSNTGVQPSPPTVNWLPQYTGEELAKYQRSDPVLRKLHTWIDGGQLQSQDQVALESQAVRKFWLCWSQVERRGGVLYYRWHERTGEPPAYRLIVPAALQQEVLRSCHCPPQSGHLGREKTCHRVKREFFWVGLTDSVNQFVRRCPQCQACKSSGRVGRAEMQLYQAGAPMDRIHIDVVGPFPVSQSGNKYVLVMVDQFTRWVEVAAVPEQTAEVTARKLLQEFISRFGSPLEIHTDQGRNFESTLFLELCDLLQVAKTRTTPYHPASNGQVERFNRTLLQMIRCYVGKNQNEWDQHLHLLASAYRSSPHACTGYTPNRMMLGREVNQLQGLTLRVQEANLHRSPPVDYVADLETNMREIHEMARQHLRSSQLRSKKDHDLRARQRTFHPGDLVYVRDDARRKGQSPKLKPRWRGPALILEKLGDVLFRVQEGRKERVLHHDRLLPYLADDVPVWIQWRRHALLQVSTPGEDLLSTPERIPPVDDMGGPKAQAARTEDEEVIGREEDVSGLAEDPSFESDDLDLQLEDLFHDGDDGGASTLYSSAQVQTFQHLAASSSSGEPTTSGRCGTAACVPGGQSAVPDPEGAEADADIEALLPLTTRRGRPVRKPARFRD